MDDVFYLKDLLARVGNPSWDLCLLGDGSGQGWPLPIGWGCLMIAKDGWREWLVGGCSAGTITIAELEWITTALRCDLHKHNNGKLQQTRRVVIFSDSEITVATGQGKYEITKHNAPELWRTVQYYREVGYNLSFFHLPRNSNPAMTEADALSKHAFSLAKGWEGLKEDPFSVMPYSRETIRE